MSDFSMHPVPNRRKFLVTVSNSLINLYNNLQHKNTVFSDGVADCIQKLKSYIQQKKDECTLNDILNIYNQLAKLEYIGSGISGTQVREIDNLKEYMKDYELSQIIETNIRKSIPNVYTKQDEGAFIEDTIAFLASLYNMSDQRTQISKSIRECAEIFWEYNVTWQRKPEIATRDTIRELQTKLKEIQITRDDEISATGQQLRLLILYIHNWFYYEQKSDLTQKSQNSDVTQKSITDINAKVEELQNEVRALRRLVDELLLQRIPTMKTEVLLHQLARHT